MAEEGHTRKLIYTGVLLIQVVLCHSFRFGEVSNTLHFPDTHSTEQWGVNVLHAAVDKPKLRDDVDEYLSRFTRDTSSASASHSQPTDISTVAHLNSSYPQLIIHWAGADSDVIIALATGSILNSTGPRSQTYISKDYGKTFQDVSNDLKINDKTVALIDSFYYSKALNSHYVFSDSSHRCIFTSRNYGGTFHKFCDLPFQAKNFVLHPTDVNVLLAYNSSHLFSSIDFGFTWSLLNANVKSFTWGVWPFDTNPVTVYIEEIRTSSSSGVYRSNNLVVKKILDSNRIWQRRVVIDNVQDFEARGAYLFATKKVHLFGSHDETLQLWVSYKRGDFSNAVFPSLQKRLDYYIADASEGQVMACVRHSSNLTNLYISEIEGVEFALSLERIVYFKSRGLFTETWERSLTFADIYQVNGMRGIFIASQLTEDLKEQVSLITFDKGGEWEKITAPAFKRNGQATHCSKSENCSLHLTQQFHHLYSNTSSMPILSKKSAPGLILASGVIGKSLKGVPDIFISTNAGFSWHQVLDGIYSYAFGDHGGIMVALQQYSVTNQIYYSTNEGETWEAIKFLQGNDKIKIYGLLTEPGETTTIFSIFGSHIDRHSWLIVQLDLKSIFKNITCKRDDYKMWSLPEEYPDHGCLLGKKVVYERRINHALCYNGKHYVREQRNQNCSCRRDDYECDIGFKQNDDMKCLPDPQQNGVHIHEIPYNCTEGSFYPYTRGYRKVAGDSCKGGEEHRYDPFTYSCPIQERDEFILYTTRDKIGRINLANKQNEVLVNTGVDDITTVEFDYMGNCVYWADITQDKIKKLCFGLRDNRTVVEVIGGRLQTVEGLAYDWTARTIYWVDSEAKTIEVAKNDGRFRRVLITEEHLDRPRSIALNPRHGIMFWTDWSSNNPRICQSWMNGDTSSIKTVVSGSSLQWPNGITIDIQTERIFWTDAGKHTIMSADFNGGDPKTLVLGTYNLPHPYGIGIYKDNIYWTDWGKEALFMADKSTGQSIQTILSGQEGISDMKIISHTSQQVTGACSIGNIGCSQLCLPKPHPTHEGQKNRTCKCGDEFNVSISTDTGDETCLCEAGEIIANGTCREGTNSTSCPADRTSCNNGQCIPATWKCDHDNDCTDGSDELNCGYSTCSAEQFTCSSGHCVPAKWKCDFDDDCGDGSDENSCAYHPCTVEQFRCDNGRCITNAWKCDFDDDCKDNSDERNCTYTQNCNSWEFNCSNGDCIGMNRQCDGTTDCKDGSDEADCSTFTCSPWRHKCDTGDQCIFRTWVCDGEEDCIDGSDEHNCTSSCYMWQFSCGSGECLPSGQVCDQNKNCRDNSDEMNCANRTASTASVPLVTSTMRMCTTTEFTCADGICVDRSKRCNGINECYDHSDEVDCSSESECVKLQFHCNQSSKSDYSARHCIWDAWVCDGEKDCPHGEDEADCSASSTCPGTMFRCRYSVGCVPHIKVCDGTKHCQDGTDEAGCAFTSVKPPQTVPTGCDKKVNFVCGDQCLDWISTCDGVRDCIDGSDEQFGRCTRHNKKVYALRTKQVTSTSIKVEWIAPNVSVKNYIFSFRKMSEQSWTNITVPATSKSINQTFLEANTKYMLTVYIIDGDGTVNNALKPIVATTEVAVPTTPTNYRCYLASEDGKAEIALSWDKPKSTNGEIIRYVVYYKTIGSGSQMSKIVSPSSGKLQTTLRNELTLEQKYSFWVTAVNEAGESVPTTPINITFTKKAAATDLKSDEVKVSVTENSIHLTWTKVKSAKNYTVFYYLKAEDQTGEKKILTTIDPQITIPDLCSGESYEVEVQVNTEYGPGSSVNKNLKTTGTSFGHPTIVNVKKTGTKQVDVDFKPPVGHKSNKLNYVIYYKEQTEADTATSVKGYKNVTTSKLHKSIHKLKACEKYFFKVGVVGKCLLSDPRSVITEVDGTAEPKRLAYKVLPNHNSINLTWFSPCSYDEVSLDYIIEKRVGNSPGETTKIGKKSKNDALFYTLKSMMRGTNYTIKIRTDINDSQFSDPINVVIPPYAAVEDLIIEFTGNQTFKISWNMNMKDHPEDSLFKNYKVDIRRDADTKYHYKTTTTETDLEVTLLPGFEYTVSVNFKTTDGIYSEPAIVELPYFDGIPHDKALPSTSVLISKTNLVAITVPISLIIVILACVLIIMAVRHRRLQRSFTAFTNSHYDTRSGVTIFSSDDLGDEDTPIIQGFSDDEPLVLA